MRLTTLAVAALAASALLFTPAAAADSVTIPWGDWIAGILGGVLVATGTIAMTIVTWTLRLAPAAVRAFIDEKRREQIEQLIQKGIAWGINEAKDYVTGKTLDVKVGSEVLAGALQYAVDHGPGWLISWGGGAEKIRDKILARLEIDDGITASEIAANVTIKRPAAT